MKYSNWEEKPVPVIDSESEPYWDAAQDDKLVLQLCSDCGEYQFYPREVCRNCWSRELDFEQIQGTGTIHSYTICRVPGQPGYDEETPYPVILVELDIPSENPSGRPVRMISHIDECLQENIKVGQEVAVSFKQISEDPLVKLPVFRPINP